MVKSLLTRGMRGWLLAVLALAAFMFANTLYLLVNRLAFLAGWKIFAVTDISLPKIYQVMVLSHTGAGLLLVTLVIVFTVWHLPRVWKRQRKRTIFSGVAIVAGGLGLAITGLFIMTAAAASERAWIWWLHIGLACVIPTAYLSHRLLSYSRMQTKQAWQFAGAMVAVLAVLLTGHAMSNRDLQLTPEAQLALAAGMHKSASGGERDISRLLTTEYKAESEVPPQSRFFPSAVTTTTGDWMPQRIVTRDDLGMKELREADMEKYGFVVNQKIGADTCVRCHADIVEQWSTSAHRFASFNNPFYTASVELLRATEYEPNAFIREHQKHFPETVGIEGMVKSKWCAGCHDPALMLPGNMTKEINRSHPQTQAGLTCLACHAIDKIHDVTGNANYNISDSQEDPYIFASAKSGIAAWLHDTAVRARPDVHKRQMLKPFFKESEFCTTCHKVSLQTPVNDYRWLRGQNDYDAWHDSGVALNASRTFYKPPKARLCQDCHMPHEPAVLGDASAKNGMVRSHRFLAVNTALPFIRGDHETIARIEEFLRDEKLSVDIFAARAERWPEPVLALNHSQPTLKPGDDVEFTVVVRNKGVGHTFPGGTNDSNQGWLEVSLWDREGNELAMNGAIRRDGFLDEHTHQYHVVLVDRHGQRITKRNAQDIVTPVYVRVIGPGTADGAHYRFVVPDTYPDGKLMVRARLLWRKFDRPFTEFSYKTNPDGFRMFDDVPDLPVTEIAKDEVTLYVKEDSADVAPKTVEVAGEWVRFNDFGIAHFLQGNTREARRAFEYVARLQPEQPDGHRNLARVAIQDGNLEGAYEHLRACEELVPGNSQTAWFWGVVLQEDGQYARAAEAYRRVLEEWPDDRAAWQNLGRTLYLDGKYADALKALDEALRIDPEDRVAHQHRMFCHRALGDEENAEIARQAFERYSIDESAQELTREFRLKHPAVNKEAQMIHVHDLVIQGGLTGVASRGKEHE